MKEMEQQVKTATKLANTVKTQLSDLRSRRDGLSAELLGLQRDQQAVQEQQNICETGLIRLNDELQHLTEEVLYTLYIDIFITA